MIRYKYQAVDERGNRQSGGLEAPSRRHARQILRAMGLTSVSLTAIDTAESEVVTISWELPRWRLSVDDGRQLLYRQSRSVWLSGALLIVVAVGLAVFARHMIHSWLLVLPIVGFCAFLGLGGFIAILYRQQLGCDAAAKEIRERSGIGPFFFKPRILNGQRVQCVILEDNRCEKPSTESSGAPPAEFATAEMVSFTVKLALDDGSEHILDTSASEHFERDLATRFARCLGVNIQDRTHRPSPAPSEA